MVSFFNEILKRLPPELADMINIINYSSSKISIIRLENGFSTPNAYDIYKFILPLNNLEYPLECIDKNSYHLEIRNIFPINPGQTHFSQTDVGPIIKTPPSLEIFIDKRFVQNTARTVYGKNNVFFENKNSKLNSNLDNLINLFIEETINKQPGYQFVLDNLNLQITINILRTIASNCNHSLTMNNPSGKKTIKRVIDYLRNNYNQDFSLEDIADFASYSPFHFIRIFTEETGKTPFEYLLDIKIDKSKQLLKNSNQSITDICFVSGFNNRSHFSVVFKKKTGYSPSQYRKIFQS